MGTYVQPTNHTPNPNPKMPTPKPEPQNAKPQTPLKILCEKVIDIRSKHVSKWNLLWLSPCEIWFEYVGLQLKLHLLKLFQGPAWICWEEYIITTDII